MRYKVIPCLFSTTRKKGWKIVEDNKSEWNYCPDGKSFLVYYKYQQALDDCEHLNGNSKVFGMITQNNWDILRFLAKDYMRGIK